MPCAWQRRSRSSRLRDSSERRYWKTLTMLKPIASMSARSRSTISGSYGCGSSQFSKYGVSSMAIPVDGM